jgi:segregation and condensation protein B
MAQRKKTPAKKKGAAPARKPAQRARPSGKARPPRETSPAEEPTLTVTEAMIEAVEAVRGPARDDADDTQVEYTLEAEGPAAEEITGAGEEEITLVGGAADEVPTLEAGAPADEAPAAEDDEVTQVHIRVPAPDDAEAVVEISPEAPAELEAAAEATGPVAAEQLESLLESLLFVSDKPLSVNDLKRLVGERDGKKITAALEALSDRRFGSGIQVVNLAGGWHLRTNPAHTAWVSKLMAGRPARLSRAMLETLAIVAYRQPITRPEIDDIRGVDCGPVLGTLLERGLIRIIGKKEEVGRPMLYGTTSEFLRIFSLKDLTELPTLRQFHELSAEHQAKVDEAHGGASEEITAVTTAEPAAPAAAADTGPLTPEPPEDDDLLEELEKAAEAAARAAGPLGPEPGAAS